MANIIYEMSQEKVALITEEERATVTFLSEASELGIGVTNVLEIGPRCVNNSFTLIYLIFQVGTYLQLIAISVKYQYVR